MFTALLTNSDLLERGLLIFKFLGSPFKSGFFLNPVTNQSDVKTMWILWILFWIDIGFECFDFLFPSIDSLALVSLKFL